MKRFIDFVKAMPFWRFIALFVFLSIIISEILIATQSLWLYGEVRQDFLIIGFITPAINAFIVFFIAAIILDTLKRQEIKQQLLVAELRKSEERFSLAMRGANDGLWDWNLETDEVYYSPRWKSMLGYEEHELDNVLNTWGSLVHPDDKDRVLARVQDYLSGTVDSYEVEMRMLHKDGHELVILSRAFAQLNDAEGKPVHLVGTHVDITERKKAETFNQKTATILKMIAIGKPAAEIYDAIALMYEGRHPGMRCSLLELRDGVLLHGGAPSLPKEYCDAVHGLKNGPNVGSCGTSTFTGKRCLVENIETDPKWADIRDAALPHGMRSCWSEPIINSKGEVLGAFGMYYDHPGLPDEEESEDLKSAARLASIVMERDQSHHELDQHRQKLEELVIIRTRELEESKQDAEEANHAKSLFLANMSHEIRTPLNAVLGMARIGLRNNSDPDSQGAFNNILESGKYLLGIINDILDFSKIEAGKLSIESQPFQLVSAIENAINMNAERAKDKDLKLSVNLQSELPAWVLGDSLRIQQILLNLLSNAIKFTTEGEVSVSVYREGDLTRFTISDTGIGVSEDQLARLFTPFEQADSSTTRQYGGTGLGLAISYKLAQLMGGEIVVQSQPTVGSTFQLTLSLVETRRPAEQTSVNQKSMVPRLKGIRILVAEDVEINRLIIEDLLEQEEASVVLAEDGQQAIERLNEVGVGNIDLVLMDVQMPIMDGYEATRRIIELAPQLPVIGVTAHALTEDRDKCLAAGMVDHATKPIEADMLIKTILSHIKARAIH